ncbi:MAG: hypothetical protein WDZ76_05170 [Pseudohongiellaceae bacterium]
MEHRTFRQATSKIAAILLLFGPAAGQTQEYWNPFASTPNSNLHGTVTYDPDSSQLTLPFVTVRPTGEIEGELLFGVVLTHTGDNMFRLDSVAELPEDQECTRDEVNAAIDQLNLNLTLDEAESLIGCEASIGGLQTDLEKGRLVQASWTGADGIPNTGLGLGSSSSYVFSGNPMVWRVASHSVSYVPFGSFLTPSGAPIHYANGTPSISLQFREGILESFSYTSVRTSQPCDNPDFVEHFPHIQAGESYAEVVAVLQCEGQLTDVTVSEDGESRQYLWNTGSSPLGADEIRTSSSAYVIFLNDNVEEYVLTSSVTNNNPTICTIEELNSAYASLQEGQPGIDLEDRVPCDPQSVRTTISSTSTSTSYSWGTTNVSPSIFESVNRSLSVQTVDNVVHLVNLTRH